jgi:hypothetical protein
MAPWLPANPRSTGLHPASLSPGAAMKTLSGILTMGLAATLAACGGGSSSSAPPSAVGMWEGTYDVTVAPAGGDIQVAMLDDGTLTVRTDSGEGWSQAAGTYSVSGATVTASFVPESDPGTTLMLTGTLSSSGLSGTLGEAPSSSDVGTFTVTRQVGGAIGIWKGQYGIGADPLSEDYLIINYPGGDVEVHDGATLSSGRALGTWSLAGSDYTADFEYGGGGSYSVIATRSGDTLSGTWGDLGDGTNGGNLSVTRER